MEYALFFFIIKVKEFYVNSQLPSLGEQAERADITPGETCHSALAFSKQSDSLEEGTRNPVWSIFN